LQDAAKPTITALRDAAAPNPDCPAESRGEVFFPGEICIGRCGAMCIIDLWRSPLGQSSSKWDKTCYAPIPVIMPNFIAGGQTMFEKSVTKNLLRQRKLNIPTTILPCGGIITFQLYAAVVLKDAIQCIQYRDKRVDVNVNVNVSRDF